jgi:Domain of unknown function (DUF4145)
MPLEVVPPTHQATVFTCLGCGNNTQQDWYDVNTWGSGHASQADPRLTVASCHVCLATTLWWESKLVYPDAAVSPLAHSDMPATVKADYDEARQVLRTSPRSAAALLRLGVQKLCAELGEPGKNINDDIAGLVKKGLDPLVQQALDVLRVVGNNAVHPGQIDLDDDVDTAASLFDLVNLIVERMIALPKKVGAMYDALPASALAAITKRDGDGAGASA